MRFKFPTLPQTAWIKPALYAGAAILIVLAFRSFGSSIKEFFFGNPEVIRAQAETVVQAERAEGITEASTQSMDIVVRVREAHGSIDATTTRNDHAIKQAPEASTAAPGVADRLQRALCLRDAYRGEPDCAPLPGAR
jgi:hypothetical protein